MWHIGYIHDMSNNRKQGSTLGKNNSTILSRSLKEKKIITYQQEMTTYPTKQN